MADLKENCLCILSTTTGVDMKTAQANTLYTVPTGKVLYVHSVCVRNPSASMAGGIDYDFTGWIQTVTLATMTTLGTDFMFVTGEDLTTGIPVKYTEQAAAVDFQITVNTGTTAACTATIDVIGFIA